MKKDASTKSAAKTAENDQQSDSLPAGRLAFTPGEFASCCGHAPVWGYRQIYSGRIRILDQPGHFLIPRSEVERFLTQVVVYSGRPVIPKAISKATGNQDFDAR